jgi:hypothetical protein
MVMRLYAKGGAFISCQGKDLSFFFPFAALSMPLPAAVQFALSYSQPCVAGLPYKSIFLIITIYVYLSF